MSIKLTLLKSGETLISEMKELVAEDTEQAHAYLLENPHKVETREKSFLTEEEKKTGDFGIDVILIPWIILSADKKVIIPVNINNCLKLNPLDVNWYLTTSKTFLSSKALM